MPDRCDRRCSTVTPSSIAGRSLPRTERTRVESSSTPSSIRLTTASAAKPFAALASPKRVSSVFAISKPRCARPYALASSIRSPWSIRTTPENPVPDARASSSPPRSDMRQTLAGACIRGAECPGSPIRTRETGFPRDVVRGWTYHPAMAPRHEAEELLLIEEADAWFEYLEATRGQTEPRYPEIEPWAWARLNQRLRAVRTKRAKLRPAAAA